MATLVGTYQPSLDRECRSRLVSSQFRRWTAKSSAVHRKNILLIGKITARWGYEHLVNVTPHLKQEVPHGVQFAMTQTSYTNMVRIGPRPNQGVPHGVHFPCSSSLQHFYYSTVGCVRRHAKYHNLPSEDHDNQQQYAHRKSPAENRANRKE